MRRKLLLVTLIIVIARNIKCASVDVCSNHIDGKCDYKSSTDLQGKSSPEITVINRSTESLKSAESDTLKETTINVSELNTKKLYNEVSSPSLTVDKSEDKTSEFFTKLNLTDKDSEIYSSTVFSTTITHKQKDVLETITEEATETTFTEETTTPITQDSTIETTTTDENPIMNECKLNNTSHEISDLNELTVSWELNDSSSCNSSTVNLILINQNCLELSCNEEKRIEADRLNFTFLKNLTPCISYSYQIQIVNSSDLISMKISEILKYQKPKEPALINITDTTVTFKVILNDPESECKDIIYEVECKSNESGSISKNSTTDIVLIENLEPRQNYSCSARVKHGETDWSQYSEASIFTTNATDCNLRNATYEIKDETNNLTIFWETNGSEMCDTAIVSITLTNKNCIVNCNQLFEVKADNLKYNFLESLTPCATYFYEIQIINSTTPSKFNKTFDAYKKYAEIKNLTITDEEEIENSSKTLNMVITWEYENNECKENFEVLARGQNNNYQSTIQGYTNTFKNLQACEEFNVTIYIKDNQNIITSAIHTMKRIIPSEIRNLLLSQEDDKTSINVAWMAPEYGAKCIDRYMIYVKNDFEYEFIRNTTSNVYLLSDVYACVNYTIMVSISTSEIDDENSETTLFSTTSTIKTTTFSVSISPAIEYISESSINSSIKTEPRQFVQTQNLQLNKQTDKSLSFTVVPSNDPKNKCPIVKYYVECTSTETGNKTESASNTSNIVEVDKLEPFHNYSCKASIENENQVKSIWSYNTTFMTKEGVPNAPNVEIAQGTVTSTSFTIKWKEPTSPKGIIKQYHVYIRFEKFKYDNPSYCTESVTGENKTLLVENLVHLSYTFKTGLPSSSYTVHIRASNQAFDGDFSSSKSETTKAGPSDILEEFNVHHNEIRLYEAYNKTIFIDFNYPCRANGEIQEFVVEFKSSKNTFNKTIPYDKNEKEDAKYNFNLKIDELEPDIFYTIYGYANEKSGIKGKEYIYRDFKLNAGIPELNEDIEVTSESTTTSIYISISDNLFDSNVGKITHARIFILQWNCTDMSYKQGFNHQDDQHKNIFWEEAMSKKCIPEYDTGITLFNDRDKKQVEGIGTESYCEPNSRCNGRLQPGTIYGVTFKLYTETGYANTAYFKIATNKEVPIVAISIIILSILCLVFLIGFYISCRRTQELRKSALDSPYDRKDISVQNFLAYHIVMSKSDNEKIKEEYKAIQYFSENLDRTFIASRANEKLNRYSNICPYDSTRVVLNDDEFENDYINASYINGYYYPKEYIAAQGPKPDTVLDFWRMILQHRIESIVMLTSLVENNKVKCHEYFPRLNGHLKSANITITCVKEQNFPSYIKRVLIVEKVCAFFFFIIFIN
ncbi:hypothetical protein ACKWTF_002163 [Chironomus riparius]